MGWVVGRRRSSASRSSSASPTRSPRSSARSASEFSAERADVSLVFGLSGLIYFLLGAGAGMLADRFGPRLVCATGMVVHRRRPAREQLRAIDGGDLRRLGRRARRRHRPGLRAVDRVRAAVVRAPARVRRRHRQRRHRRRHARACRCSQRRRSPRSAGAMRCRRSPRACSSSASARRCCCVARRRARRARHRGRGSAAERGAAQPSLLVDVRGVRPRRAGDVHSVRARLGGGARPRHRRCARGRPGRPDRRRQHRRPLRDRRPGRPARPHRQHRPARSVARRVLPALARRRRLPRRWRCSRSGSASATAASSR